MTPKPKFGIDFRASPISAPSSDDALGHDLGVSRERLEAVDPGRVA